MDEGGLRRWASIWGAKGWGAFGFCWNMYDVENRKIVFYETRRIGIYHSRLFYLFLKKRNVVSFSCIGYRERERAAVWLVFLYMIREEE
ncbi:TPA: hypothetical protein ACQUHP_006410 [Bacillus cereus]